MSIPAQVAYTTSQPGGSQERLPSIRDLNFNYHHPGQGATGRPSRQQPPQAEQVPNPPTNHNVQARPPAAWSTVNPSQPPVAPTSMPPPSSTGSQDYHHHVSQPAPPSSTGSSLSRHETYGGHSVPPISSGHAPIHRVDTGNSMQPPQKRPRSESIQSPSIPHVSGGRTSQHVYTYPQQSASPYSSVSIPPPPHSGSSSISSQSLPPASHPYAQQAEYPAYPSGYPAQHASAPRQAQMSPPASGVYSPEAWQHHQQSPPQHVQHSTHPPPPQMSSMQATPMHQPPPPVHSHLPPPSAAMQQSQQQQPPQQPAPHAHASHYSQHHHHHQPQLAPHSGPSHAQHPPQAAQPTQQPTAPPVSASSSYIRTTAIVPTPVEPLNRPAPAANTGHVTKDVDDSIKRSLIPKIQECCVALYDFANRYASLQHTQPQVRPSESEIAEMAERAALVVKLLEEVRRLTSPEGADNPGASLQLEGRAPKRPWEDISNDDGNANASFTQGASQSPADKMQSMAEKDMAIIRSKRATNTGAVNAGVPKGKYRKRSRANPPGKCHSCNIRETPEWRRGPDGARTLCNACGLHYAKLIRKRDKQLGADGQPVRIDLETLRASTRAGGDKENSQHLPQKSTNDVPLPSQPNTHSQSQVHTPGTQSMSASPTVATSKTPGHPAHTRPPPPSAASSAPYSYSPLSSAGASSSSIPPPQPALSSSHVEHMNAGTAIWTNHTARNYGGEQSSFLRPHAPAEPRSTSA